jgi:hypothetical protein
VVCSNRKETGTEAKPEDDYSMTGPYLIAEMQRYGARSTGSSARRMAVGPIAVGDKLQELCERWYALCLAPRRKHVVCQVEFMVIPAVVLPDENLDSTPRALDGICVCPGVRINEVDAVVNGAMCVTLRTEITVRAPAITNDRSAGFDPVMYDGH